jgi:hypothetical protein
MTRSRTSSTSTSSRQDQTKQDFSKAGDKLKRHIYDYVITDSNTEREFVKELDTCTEVVVYAKLPRGFLIPTPVGDYNPDWAISFKEGAVKHVYFVAETKGSMSVDGAARDRENQDQVRPQVLRRYQQEIRPRAREVRRGGQLRQVDGTGEVEGKAIEVATYNLPTGKFEEKSPLIDQVGQSALPGIQALSIKILIADCCQSTDDLSHSVWSQPWPDS